MAALRTFEGGPPLGEGELTSFEKEHGLCLPAAYREFLLATNGGRPERDLLTIPGLSGNSVGRIHVFFGLKDPVESCNLDWNLAVFRDRIPASQLPIATTEGVDKVCLAVTGESAGAVFYWDGYAQAGERNLYFLAADFASFIASLQKDELSPRMRAS
ncbi:SMI1/KNR4 family protein [Hyalangium gracile]|uniref:SMI1/KNR4 family protein n=1 Tax=Hyalangium gracile TaxID=394092 RepID=UPI001CCD1C66|nr:SMI1/KNR4 family protein [Hyalangium gracile]